MRIQPDKTSKKKTSRSTASGKTRASGSRNTRRSAGKSTSGRRSGGKSAAAKKKKPVTDAGKRREARKKKKGRKKKAGIPARLLAFARVILTEHRAALYVFCVAAAVAGIFLFCITHVVLGQYAGLGEKQELLGNTYTEDAFHKEDGRIYYEDNAFTSRAGIDVSVFQGDIDWEAVAADGIEFAMIRVGYRSITDGEIRMDDQFKKNLNGAKEAGLDVGVYFFSQARNVDEAVKEAKYVIRHVRGKGISLPIAYDMEYLEGDRISDLSAHQRTRAADAFCSIVEQNGYPAMIYGNPTWFSESIEKEYLEQYPTWLAHYTDHSDYAGSYTMWQYSEKGKVKGIRKKVDLNIQFSEKN